jgi:WD40 repeat protein
MQRVILTGFALLAAASATNAAGERALLVAAGPAGVECVVTTGPAVPVSAVAFSPDAKTVASGGYNEVLLWDVVEGKLAKRLGLGIIAGRVGAVCFLDEGKRLAAGDGTPGRDGSVKVFDVATGALVRTFAGLPDTVRCLALNPDGSLLAAGGAFTEARVWKLADGTLVHAVGGHADWVTGVAFSPDGSLLATVSLDKSVLLTKTEDWTRAGRGSSPEPLRGVAFDARGGSVVAAAGGPSERTIRIWSARYMRNSRPGDIGPAMPMDVLWSRKSGRVYAATGDGAIRSTTAWRGKPVAFKGRHADWVYAVAFDPEESRIVSGGADGTVRLWNVAEGTLVATFVQLAPRTDDWAVVAATGHAASSREDAISWRATGEATLPEGFAEQARDVDAFRKALAGEAPKP